MAKSRGLANEAKRRMPNGCTVGDFSNNEIGSRVADIGAGGKEYNVKTDKAWDDAQKAKKAK